MKILAKTGRCDIATVYVAETSAGKRIEFVESVQPPIPREKKWVLIVSSLYGCPAGCKFCDAGGYYRGKLSKEDIFAQIDYAVRLRFGSNSVPVEKFKIQFARMGEPALNENVLDVLDELPDRFDAPGLMPSVSTIAPQGTDAFFERLLEIKSRRYRGRFQMQFSIHTASPEMRKWLIPMKIWDFDKIAECGRRFVESGDRKVTLNFALAENMPVDAAVMRRHFDPQYFVIKITPVNPTYRAKSNALASHVVPGRQQYEIIDALRAAGYGVILSIGELEENNIGSNCGQYINTLAENKTKLENSYTYELQAEE